MKRALLVAIAGALFLSLQPSSPISAQAPDGLTFFKNYFITGDYAVAGVGLRGTGVNGIATGSITMAQVPPTADIVAAFLYWQVVSTDVLGPDSGNTGVTFEGIPLTTTQGPVGKVLDQAGSNACWIGGGAPITGLPRTYTYRADVLRYFAIDETTGKPRINGGHQVQVPDAGLTGDFPNALGASLVVVYRDPSLPLNGIVVYDGGSTVDAGNPTMSQVVRGFYQPSAAPQAKISYVVGSGRSNKNEQVFLDGGLFLTNPFGGFDGASWDTVTQPVDLGADPVAVTSVTTAVSRDAAPISADCLTVSAILFKTAVKDTDGDGLLDVWESSPAPIVDPEGQPLPLLSAMGASPNRKDIFVELGYMDAAGDTSYGGVTKPAHSHLPTHEALKLAGDAFKNAPVVNPDGSTGITMHFDVGAGYPAGDPADPAKNASEYLIPAGLSRGGEAIDEMRTVCARGPLDPPWVCQFSDYPGTVGWKTGFRFLRDEIVGSAPAPLPGEPDVCDAPGNDGPGEPCERRFDRNRTDIFHYVLFAHAVGLPKSERPCLDAGGAPVEDVDGVCAISENPNFRVPQTITGVGDFPGGDVLVALGAFADGDDLPLGTPFMQASTLTHELGHNLERRHGGEAFEPNCKPSYLSSMNYLYQLRGLLDDAGKPHLDLSRAALDPAGGALDETSIFDGSLSLLPYRIGWYAPLAGSYLEGQVSAAGKHCDGTPILAGEVPMVRIDARTAAEPIDWNANGVATDAAFTQDLNFDGRTQLSTGAAQRLRGSDDWANVHLNQVGSRRNVGGLFADASGRLGVGPLSLDTGRGDFGRGDFGRGDFGRGDFGRGDFGRGDLGRGDFGRGDFGRGDFGRGDFGRGDFGGGDLFAGNPDLPGGELDFETATSLAKAPPTEFTACVVGTPGCAGAETHQVRATWKSPNLGGVSAYLVFRVTGASLTAGQTWTQIGAPIPAVAGQELYALLDVTGLQSGQPYTYFTIAVYADGVRSDPSNLVTVTGIDEAPTLSGIANQTIFTNGTTGPLALTVGDEQPATVVLSGHSSNQALVPDSHVVFGGNGAARTVTVTPAPGQSGAATITIGAVDIAGGSATPVTFLLTVQPQEYAFTGFLSPLKTAGSDANPTDSGTFTFGKAIPIKWKLKRGGVNVTDLDSLASLVAVPGNPSHNPLCVANGEPPLMLLDPATGRPTGNSTYRYASGGFIFNWDTSAAVKSRCYRLTLSLDDGSAPKVTVIHFKDDDRHHDRR